LTKELYLDWDTVKALYKQYMAMDMWKPFRRATADKAPQAAILFDKFHIIRHLGEALDEVRKSEYARLSGRQRRYIKGQKYTRDDGMTSVTHKMLAVFPY
jgi:transposase